ncbi:YfbM family protein [Streptomyces sp. HNM0574]|uniref:YfbM family protein n=1 Tax=Streptomyces sp. HNM0574 TaxID=2714954 RepID=UPI00146AD483|nr:YfbM family protein [Streptomyces sp. HNM0574]NLU66740.1 YfbM family protein [Streptomyces sp. HNM0574]
MSVTISFVSATPEELDRAEKEPDWADEYVDALYDFDDPEAPGRPDCGPEKAWAGLQFLFDEAEVDVDLLMDGFTIQEDGTLFGWTPEQIASLARDLRATPWQQLAAHYHPEEMTKEDVYPNMWRFDPDSELEWLKDAYEELVAFCTAAAERGYGAFMMFSF